MAGHQLISIRKETHENLKLLADATGKSQALLVDELVKKEMIGKEVLIKSLIELKEKFHAENISSSQN